MASSINASTSGAGGLVSTADSSGVLDLQAGGTSVVKLTGTSSQPRITGDFSNATVANRVTVQSSTTNGNTQFGLIPNGTSTVSTFQAFGNSSDPANSPYAAIQYNGLNNASFLYSSATGTGTLTPLYVHVGGAIQMSIATDGTITGTKGNLQLISGTAVASTSGTSIDFTGIPSWAKRITVMFNGVSLSGNSQIQIQLGTVSGVETTGYSSGGWVYNAGSTSTTGLLLTGGFVAAWAYTGIASISLVGSNLWVASSNGNNAGSSSLAQGAGSKTTAATLDRVRITTLNGTDTFDAGSINIMYE